MCRDEVAMKVNILDLQRRYWPILGYLPHSLLKNTRLVYVLGCTGTDVILVTNDHKVFFKGFNRTLTGSELHDVSNMTEMKALSEKHIKGFACNSNHCLGNTNLFVVSLLMNGEVYLWGLNPSDGCVITAPLLIVGLPKTVVKVACGEHHFLALTSDGQVYAWGSNRYGQIATNLTKHSVSKPHGISKFLTDGENVVEIACGSHFSVVITSKRKVFGWGRNDDGQLGENKSKTLRHVVRELFAFRGIGIQQIVCGANHILALNNSGTLFACGSNALGQLGYDDSAYDSIPLRFKEIAAAVDSSVGETLDGEIMVWGYVFDEIIRSPMKTPCCSINEAFALYRLGGMHKPIEVNAEGENVAEIVRNSFGNPETSDFKIIVQDKEIYVHKSILAIRSKFFERMFAKNWLEGKKSFVKMEESYEGMSAFLKYLYTDEINNVDMKVLCDVAVIAEKYCELYLVNLCLKQFESGLNQSNVAELYELTLDQRLSKFNDSCIDYASHCLSAVVASKGYSTWNPETFQKFFQHDKITSVLTTSD